MITIEDSMDHDGAPQSVREPDRVLFPNMTKIVKILRTIAKLFFPQPPGLMGKSYGEATSEATC